MRKFTGSFTGSSAHLQDHEVDLQAHRLICSVFKLIYRITPRSTGSFAVSPGAIYRLIDRFTVSRKNLLGHLRYHQSGLQDHRLIYIKSIKLGDLDIADSVAGAAFVFCGVDADCGQTAE
jgi:hypothetical protein